MLSILVPVFNQTVVSFVEELLRSAKKSNLVFELIVVEDGSSEAYLKTNKHLHEIPEIHYIIHSDNLGRAAIRNFLAAKATYNNLLFLDADGQLLDDLLISNYKSFLNSDEVVSGGRKYTATKPLQKDFYLHWKYGIQQESQVAARRNLKPVLYFHSNNFLVSKALMTRFPFNETFKKYGYEDLDWASNIQVHHIRIQHVDNPILHVGLDSNLIFLRKVEDSIENLVANNHLSWVEQLTLIKAYKVLENLRLLSLFLIVFNYRKKRIIKNLLSDNPTLWSLQWYKLGQYAKKAKEFKERAK